MQATNPINNRSVLRMVRLAAALAAWGACSTESPRDARTESSEVAMGKVQARLVASDSEEFEEIAVEVFQGSTRVAKAEIVPTHLTLPDGKTDTVGGDAFFVLPAGDYTVSATPEDADKQPSKRCKAVSRPAKVLAGATTELILTILCSGEDSGALDVVVATEHTPTLNDLRLKPGKFLHVCQPVTITALASDPDGAPLTYTWKVVAQPLGSQGGRLQTGGNVASFWPDAQGDFELTVVVRDPENHEVSLRFPLHVSGGSRLACDATGEAVLKRGFAVAKVADHRLPPYAIKVESAQRNEGPDIVTPIGLGLPTPTASRGTASPLPPPGVGAPGVRYQANDAFGDVITFSGSPPDMNGATGGGVVFLTGNTWAAYSLDNGGTYTVLDPTTIFPSAPAVDALGTRLDGGLCCDQIVQYVAEIGRFVWLLQHWPSGPGLAGKNKIRIAAASPEAIRQSGGTAWTYWDLSSDFFGLGNDWMDYPEMTVSDRHLAFSIDEVGTGLLVGRIPLADIGAGGTALVEWTDTSLGGAAYGSRIMQNSGDTLFWAGHDDDSRLRVFSLQQDSSTYFWRTVDIGRWPASDRSSIAPNGNDWLAFGFPGTQVHTGVRRFAPNGPELWFAWTAGRRLTGATSDTFPQPHVEIAVLNAGFGLIARHQIWNSEHAYAYPAFATTSDQEVGMSLGWGGGTFHEGHVVGFWGDFVVYTTCSSATSGTRWGDYVSARRASPNPRQIAATGYCFAQDASGNAFYDPTYTLFERPAPPPIP